MPAEWEPQAAIWLSWPHKRKTWPKQFRPIPPAFAKIAGCVCDGGGMLSHAAIVGREYGVPTVTAVGLGTVVIAEGDEVEVDGDTGTVTVIKKA